MNAKQRLTEWALWRLEPGFEMPTASTPLQRIRDDEENAGAGADCFHYDMVEVDGEAVACMPDGGMADIVERMAGAIDHDNRCREIDRLVREMHRFHRGHWTVVDVTFSGTHPRDVMKGALVSSRILGLSVDDYRARMRTIYQWVESRLGLMVAA